MSSTPQTPVATLEPAKTASANKLLRRSEAARLLGVSVSTLRRREGEMLNPIVGPDGVHLFDEAEVRAVSVTVRARSVVGALGPSAGETAAAVFTLLDDCVHPVEIVKRLHLTPDVVTALQEQWVRMRGGFTVTPSQAVEFGRLANSGTPTSGASALANMTARIARLTRGSAVCQACGDKTASLCEPCTIETRAPLGTSYVKIEQRVSETGVDETRIVAELYWDDVGDGGGAVATLRSDWFATDSIAESSISDMAAGAAHFMRARS